LPPGDAAHLGAAGGVTHRRVVGEIPLAGTAAQGTADQPATVSVEEYTDPEGQRHAPVVRLTLPGAAGSNEPDTDDLTSREARGLAEALLEAARLAES
jgi:hypothetical protein